MGENEAAEVYGDDPFGGVKDNQDEENAGREIEIARQIVVDGRPTSEAGIARAGKVSADLQEEDQAEQQR
jgi:hypothetical protein